MKKITLAQAKEMYEATAETLERQSTALPTIRFYKNEVFFDSCSVGGGSFAVTQQGLTEEIISTDELRGYLSEWTKTDGIRCIWEACNDFLKDKNDGEK